MTNPNAIMVKAKGYLSYRPDDHGSGTSNATLLVGAVNAANRNRSTTSAVGGIQRTGDVDWLKFYAGAGNATVTVAVTPLTGTQNRADVDLKLDITMAGRATPLATFNPQGALLSGPYPVLLPTNNTYYYVVLTGVGNGANASVGYSNYGESETVCWQGGEFGCTCTRMRV